MGETQTELPMTSATPPVQDLPPVGRRYDVDGRRLYLHQSGTGRPVVVFLPGAGAFGLSYFNVHDRVAELTTSVLYDRAGTGWSDDVEWPRTAKAVVEELHALLRAAGLPGPYVFVGHSLGGLFARRFAQLFPNDVAGLLLLDPAHEDFEANLPEVARKASEAWKSQPTPEFTPEMIEAYRPILSGMYASWPPDLREAMVTRHLGPARVKTGLVEANNAQQLYDEVRHGGPVPPVPTIVYTAMGIDPAQVVFSSEEVVRAQNQGKLITNEAFARSIPGAESRVLADAGHAMLHIQGLDAVVEGARDLLTRIRA
jgi:pimeloyl-ACP methyl ester carboxylesterase